MKLATRFANDRGGIGSVSSAFIASGESLVDAVSVSGLAGFMDAPVLLTRSGSLHGGVADFLEDYGIGNLYVLGGEAAVSGAVEDALKGLASSPSVTRISGNTRYDTSAAIASNLSGESWCGTNENSAIVVNGADDSLFNAVAIGPVANRLELPVLLTAGDDLVDAVVSYIEAEDVEHAVIVGGTGSVSEGVEQALGDAGVDTVERIDGDSPAAVSVAIAGVMGDACADDLSPVSTNTVALINSDSVIDGIPAAPVLADDADQLGGGLIPILAVGDTLPASVRDYLAATPEEDAAGNKVHLRVLAVGGTAAVSDSVMAAAVSAAASADSLSVTIGTVNNGADGSVGGGDDAPDLAKDGKTPIIVSGRTQLRLYFSDDVASSTAIDLRNRLEDILQVNDIPADIETDASTAAVCDPDSVTVNLKNAVRSGDTIAIVSGGVRVGAGGDRRTVQPTSATVPAPASDTQRPSIRIVAIIGHNEVYGLVSDNTALDNTAGTLLAGSLTDANGDPNFQVTAGDVGVTGVTVSQIDFTDSATTKGALLTFALGDVSATTDVTESGVVDANDRFRANRGAVEDAAENESQVTTGVPVRPVSKLQVSSVQMSNLRHTANAVALIPAAYAGASAPALRPVSPSAASPDVATNPAMWLQAKADGAAAGAVGNGWSIRGDRSSSWSKDKPVDIQVFVSTKDRRIVMRVVNGEPKFADVKAALEGNATVNSMFNVLVDNQHDANGDTCKSANPKIQSDLLHVVGATETGDDVNQLAGGVTKARVQVNFNGWVEDIVSAQSGRLMDAVLLDTLNRNIKAGSTTITDQATLRTALGLSDADAFVKAATAGPTRSGMVDVTTSNAGALPLPRDIVDIPDGFDKNTDGTPVDSDTSTDVVDRTDATGNNSVANGYGDTTAALDNDFNYGSKVRITRNSNVVAPQ